MAQTYLQLADRTKLGTDSKNVNVDAASHLVARQQLVTVPGNALAEQGVAIGEVVTARLATAGGAVDANVNGSVVGVAFEYEVAAGKVLLLDELELVVRDTGAFTGASFGAGSALTNGLRVEVIDTDGVTVRASLLAGASAKINADLAEVPGAVIAMPWIDTLQAWLPVRAEGWPIRLTAGQRVRMTVADDLSGLDGLRATLRGRLA